MNVLKLVLMGSDVMQGLLWLCTISLLVAAGQSDNFLESTVSRQMKAEVVCENRKAIYYVVSFYGCQSGLPKQNTGVCLLHRRIEAFNSYIVE